MKTKENLKLPGQPNIKVYFNDNALGIPIFIISNEDEQEFFTEFFNRLLHLGRFFIYRRLVIQDPYQGKDPYGQQIYAETTISIIEELARQESVRFKTVTEIKIDSIVKYYDRGKEISKLPDQFSYVKQEGQSQSIIDNFFEYFRIDKGQSQSIIDNFFEYFRIDRRSIRYPSDILYGKHEVDLSKIDSQVEIKKDSDIETNNDVQLNQDMLIQEEDKMSLEKLNRDTLIQEEGKKFLAKLKAKGPNYDRLGQTFIRP